MHNLIYTLHPLRTESCTQDHILLDRHRWDADYYGLELSYQEGGPFALLWMISADADVTRLHRPTSFFDTSPSVGACEPPMLV